ncbi:MAG: hypothetical protein AAGJ37_14665 [Pseudomonadota bacterium]
MKSKLRAFWTTDTVKSQYEGARMGIAKACLPLSFKDTTIEQLENFVSATLSLHEACSAWKAFETPQDVLFWLRRRLIQEARKPARSAEYRSKCLTVIQEVEQKIASGFVTQSNHRLSLLE